MKKLLAILLVFLPCWCWAASAVKTYNGVADGSVKTLVGVATASAKTANGVDYNDDDAAACTTTFIDTSACSATSRNMVSTSGQFIKNSSARTICKITAYLTQEYSETATAHIEIWSDIAKAGTKYGGNSSQVVWSSYQEGNFTWSASKPNPSGDFYVHFVIDSGSYPNQYMFKAQEECYEDNTYNAFTGGSITNRDAAMKIYGE
jgi:hypothetical protein